jgi:hypothetical protein
VEKEFIYEHRNNHGEDQSDRSSIVTTAITLGIINFEPIFGGGIRSRENS